MRRRKFITILAGAAAWPVAAHVQQLEHVAKLGILMPYAEDDSEVQHRLTIFRNQLRDLGWVEGQNLQIEERWSADDMGRIRQQATQLISLKPDVILVAGRRAAPVLGEQTRTIPIVFVGISDPVTSGLVKSLARPGGNLTGLAQLEFSLVGKLVEALKEIAPAVTHVALISNPDNPATELYRSSFETAAVSLDLEPVIFAVHQPADIKQAIESVAHKPNAGVVFPPDLTILIHRKLAIAAVAKHRLPAVYTARAYAADGGLISYGVEVLDLYRRAALYVDRILRGEKPSNLPVELPTRLELVINLKTAKELGMAVPPTLLVRADEVIE